MVEEGTLYLYRLKNGVGITYEAELKNGWFGIELPDGKYYLNQLYTGGNQEVIALSRQFTVADGKLDSGTLQLTLSPKLSGTFQFADGSTISNGSLSINSVNTNPSSNYSVVVRNGDFNLYLPDGNYQVSSLYKHDSQESISVNYTFTITGGQSSPSPLSITLPAAVTGTINNSDGTPVASGRLYVNRTDSGTYSTYFAEIKDGEFTLYLPDGNYRTYNLNTPEEQMIGFYQSFSVSGGKTSPNPFEIMLPKLFTGKLSYSDGSSVGKVQCSC